MAGVTATKVREMALGLPGVEEGGTASLKASKETQSALLAEDPATFGIASHVGRYGWVSVQLGTVDRGELAELVVEAWRVTATVRAVAAYDAGA